MEETLADTGLLDDRYYRLAQLVDELERESWDLGPFGVTEDQVEQVDEHLDYVLELLRQGVRLHLRRRITERIRKYDPDGEKGVTGVFISTHRSGFGGQVGRHDINFLTDSGLTLPLEAFDSYGAERAAPQPSEELLVFLQLDFRYRQWFSPGEGPTYCFTLLPTA